MTIVHSKIGDVGSAHYQSTTFQFLYSKSIFKCERPQSEVIQILKIVGWILFLPSPFVLLQVEANHLLHQIRITNMYLYHLRDQTKHKVRLH